MKKIFYLLLVSFITLSLFFSTKSVLAAIDYGPFGPHGPRTDQDYDCPGPGEDPDVWTIDFCPSAITDCGKGSPYAIAAPDAKGTICTYNEMIRMGNKAGVSTVRWKDEAMIIDVTIFDSSGKDKVIAKSPTYTSWPHFDDPNFYNSLTFYYTPSGKASKNWIIVSTRMECRGQRFELPIVDCPREPKADPIPEPVVLTVSDCCQQIVPDVGPAGNYTLNHLVQTAINIYECILCIVGALILMMLVFGAVLLLISAGNDSMLGLGKRFIVGAVVGGIIVFFSYLIVNFTIKALGARLVDPNGVQINPGGSGGANSPKGAPVPTTPTLPPTTPTTPTTPSSTPAVVVKAKTENCSDQEKEKLNKVLSLLNSDGRTDLNDVTYICGDAYCVNQGRGFLGFYDPFKGMTSGMTPACLKELYPCNDFFTVSSILAASVIVHEYTHREQCLRGEFLPNSSVLLCAREREAFSAQAKFLKGKVSQSVVHDFECVFLELNYFEQDGTGNSVKDSNGNPIPCKC